MAKFWSFLTTIFILPFFLINCTLHKSPGREFFNLCGLDFSDAHASLSAVDKVNTLALSDACQAIVDAGGVSSLSEEFEPLDQLTFYDQETSKTTLIVSARRKDSQKIITFCSEVDDYSPELQSHYEFSEDKYGPKTIINSYYKNRACEQILERDPWTLEHIEHHLDFLSHLVSSWVP